MDIKWAVKKLSEGKKVRRKRWGQKDFYMYAISGILYYNRGATGVLNIQELQATDWEVYKEPKDEWIEMTNKEMCLELGMENCNRYITVNSGVFVHADYKVVRGKLLKRRVSY